jgi:hypothetical protein
VRIDDQTMRDRFVICHNPERAVRDAAVRAEIVARLEERIAGSDSLSVSKRSVLVRELRTKPAFNRFLRRTKSGLLRVDRAALKKAVGLDDKFFCAPPTRRCRPKTSCSTTRRCTRSSGDGVT